MAIDGKYGRVTLEHGDIGEDEPVVVFRARDLTLPDLLTEYHKLCMQFGSPMRHLRLIAQTHKDIVEWQDAHDVRLPTSESSRKWME